MRAGGTCFVLRLLLLLAAFLLPEAPRAQNALILIQHDRAGPNLPSADYIHAEWIRWPAAQGGWNNRILALASGVDLQGEASDMAFRDVPNGGRASLNGRRLAARGFFDARNPYLGPTRTVVVANPRGGVSPSVLLLALDDPGTVVRVAPATEPLPSEGLVVYEAAGWDDAIGLAKRAMGRTLIVEYPPEGEEGWSRYWTRGKWPSGVPTERDVGVPGLVRARRALALLLHPQNFSWSPTDAGSWGGPNRWLEHGSGASEVVLATWLASMGLVIAWAFAQVMNEDRGPFVAELIVLLVLSPGALVLGGAAERLSGLDSWPVWLIVASTGLYAASILGRSIARHFVPDAHPIWVPCLLTFAALSLFDPMWSDLSGRFARLDLDVPPYALGVWIASLAGAAVFSPGRWFGRVLVGASVLWGTTSNPWWLNGHVSTLVLPAVALLAAEGLLRPVLLSVLALLPTSLWRIACDGAVWAPDNLLLRTREARATNLWLDAAFLISFAWIGSLCLFGTLGMVGNRFLGYRLRKMLRGDPRLRTLPWVTFATLALGVTEPLAFGAVPVIALWALLVLAFEGLRSNA